MTEQQCAFLITEAGNIAAKCNMPFDQKELELMLSIDIYSNWTRFLLSLWNGCVKASETGV